MAAPLEIRTRSGKKMMSAKFDEDTDLLKAQPPLYLTEEVEADVEDDETEELAQDDGVYRKKRRRSNLKRKSFVKLSNSTKNLRVEAVKQDTGANHVLIKVCQDNTGKQYVTVSLLSDRLTFRAPSRSTVKTVEQAETLGQQKIALAMQYQKRYVQKLKKKAEDKEEEPDEDIWKQRKKGERMPKLKVEGLGDAGENPEDVGEWAEAFKGDGDLTFSDDEEEYVQMNRSEDMEKEKRNIPKVVDDESESDTNSSDDDEDEEDEDEPMKDEYMKIKELLAEDQVPDVAQIDDSDGSNPNPSATPDEGDRPQKRQRLDPTEGRPSKLPKTDATAITEPNVRALLQSRGGKILAKDLIRFFKKTIKANDDAFKALTNITDRISVKTEGALGTEFWLK